jgi:uncharacterized membrane protein
VTAPAAPAAEPADIPVISGELPLGAFLKTGWESFKRYPLGFIGFTLVQFVIGLVMQSVPFVGWLAFWLVETPLAAGFYVVHARLLHGQPVEFGQFFSGFRSHLLLPLVLLGAVSQALIVLGFLFLVIPGVYLAVAYLFATLFLLDRERDFWPALEDSRKAVTPRWFSLFAFCLLLLLVNLGGLLLLGVGILVTVPVSYGALTAAYAHLFGLKSTFA